MRRRIRNQDPVIEDMRYFARVSQMQYSELAENCGLHISTMYSWFHYSTTRSPRHSSVKAFFNSFGVRYGLDKDAKKATLVKRAA